ncbi:MAG: tetratricopeptide repeat protein [Candidatus Omnitrophica bacterium]|nr:tetratricopeptide repeat protein [Candidatus Omnitrophota bacterium]MDD5592937.1 tetratricopeptide repeat protein [Candidatus Omnitrophota bacterium]
MNNKYIYIILIAVSFLVYANSLNNAFVSDDIPAILNYPFISQPLRFLLEPNPLSNSLNYLIGQYNPFIYHLTNIILHALNTIFIFLFLRLFFRAEASFLGSCLFAVHPIHTEAVTWISGRPYLILSLFILGTYFLYQKANGLLVTEALPPDKNKRLIVNEKNINFKLPYYVLSLLAFSYFIIKHYTFYALLPLFLILSDVTFGSWRKAWRLWLPFLGIVILRLIIARVEVMTRVTAVAKEIGASITWTNPFFNLVYSFFSHVGLILWPAKLTLYHEPAIISAFMLKVGIAALLALAAALPFIFKKAREVFFAIALFILFLLPTYSPVMISWLVAERYAYFPSVALSIIVCFFYERYVAPVKNTQRKNLILGVLIFILSCYAVRTVVRNEDWKSPERFWRQTVLASPESPRSHNNLGDVYGQEGNVEGAIREFSKAIELKTDYADGYHNLATTYYRQGNIKEAVKIYKEAVSLNPELFESHFNLGIIYLDMGQVDSAIEELQKAAELRPQDANARQALDVAMRKKNG